MKETHESSAVNQSINEFSAAFNSIGVRAAGDATVSVQNNTLIQGCDIRCNGSGHGIYLIGQAIRFDDDQYFWEDFKNPDEYILASPTWQIKDNLKIIGGLGRNSTAPSAGIHAISASPRQLQDPDIPPAHLIVQNNTLIQGTIESPTEVGPSIGVWTIAVAAEITKNNISSGKATNENDILISIPSAGIRSTGSFNGTIAVPVVITDNNIDGSAGKGTGVFTRNVQAQVERNFIHNADQGLSFHSDLNSIYSNNVVSARYACLIGCSSYNRDGGCKLPQEFLFSNNICYSTEPNKGFAVNIGRKADSRITNNIFMGYRTILGSKNFHMEENMEENLDHNAVIPMYSSHCAYWEFGTFNCYQAESSNIGVSNINILPNFVGPISEPLQLSAFRSGSDCPLAGKGEFLQTVAKDFDGKARSSNPTIGPFECH